MNWRRTLFAYLGPLLVRPASLPHSLMRQAQQPVQSRLLAYKRTYVRGCEVERVKNYLKEMISANSMVVSCRS
jgi:hypothetical protein